MQENRNFSALIEDNRSRSFGRASVPCSDSLLNQSTAEVRIDKTPFGLSYCFPAVLVCYAIALCVTVK